MFLSLFISKELLYEKNQIENKRNLWSHSNSCVCRYLVFDTQTDTNYGFDKRAHKWKIHAKTDVRNNVYLWPNLHY